MQASKRLYNELVEQWAADKEVPLNHQIRFIEGIQELPFDLMNKLLTREVEKFRTNQAEI